MFLFCDDASFPISQTIPFHSKLFMSAVLFDFFVTISCTFCFLNFQDFPAPLKFPPGGRLYFCLSL